MRAPTYAILVRVIGRIVGLAVLSALLVAAPAHAKTQIYCVKIKPSQCKTGIQKVGVQAALNAAKKNPGTDRVRIGEGTFDSAPYVYTSNDTVKIEGAGCGKTILTTPETFKSQVAVLTINSGKRSTLSGLAANIPNGDDNRGLFLRHVDATKACVTSGPRAGGAVGVRLRGATLTDGVVLLPLTTTAGPSEIRAVVMDGSEPSRLSSATLQARTAALITSDKAVLHGIDALVQRGVFVDGANAVSIHSSVFRLRGDGSRFAVDATKGAVLANQLTVYSFPTGTNTTTVGFRARADSYIRVSNTIARDVDVSLARQGFDGQATIVARYDDLDLSTAQSSGSGELLPQNIVNVDPQFGDVKGGSFQLKDSSPLIDAGAPGPSLEMGEIPQDITGRLRIVDFDKDGQARRDIGAFEKQLFSIPGKD
jgi:hypothetical protein